VLNRYIKYVNLDDHGYSVLDVTPQRIQMDWFIISDRADPKATSSRTRSYVVADGTQTVTPVSTGIV
jgi:alkaline phosphatase D